MSKIALIADTACDLNDDIVKEFDINLLPFRIIYKDREYKDRFEITSDEVYDRLPIEIPKSSLPSMEEMEDLYERLIREGYTHAIVITMSSGLSGCYNAVKLISENHPEITTYVCDSKSLSLGEGLIVECCGKMIKEGNSFENIVNTISTMRDNTETYFVVGTLEYLKKGGRIGKVAGTIAELLNIKPIVSIDREDGKYYTYDKVRGRKQSLNRLVDIAKEKLESGSCEIYVVHGKGLEDAKKVYDLLKELDNKGKVHLGGCISPVAGMHSGPGLVGLTVIKNN